MRHQAGIIVLRQQSADTTSKDPRMKFKWFVSALQCAKYHETVGVIYVYSNG